MFCSYCGNRLPEGARFCSMCGAKVALAVEVTEELDEPVVQQKAPATPEVIVDEAAVARAEAKATAAVPPESIEVPATQPAAPVRTRIAFDWSNVKDEPQKKQILNVKSPWDETGGFDEEALYKEMTPSTDRSRTMNFIDVLKAEREEEKKSWAFDAYEPKTQEVESTEKEKQDEEPPRLHFAPLYDDFDTPVKTPFDEPEQTVSEEKTVPEAEAKADVDTAPVHVEEASLPDEAMQETQETVQPEPANAGGITKEIPKEEPKEAPKETTKEAAEKKEKPAEKTAWHWFDMPDFLKPKDSIAGPKESAPEAVEPKKETTSSVSAETAEFKFRTPEAALFEEPRYEDVPETAEPEIHDEPAGLFEEPETDYSEYEEYDEYAEYSGYEAPEEPETQDFSEPAVKPEPVYEAVAETEPEPESESADASDSYTYVYDEAADSDSESDYSDYINMDMSRSASDEEITGRAASYAAEASSVEETAVSEPAHLPAAEEPVSAVEAVPASVPEVETVSAPAPAVSEAVPAAEKAEPAYKAESQSLEDDLADILAAGAQQSPDQDETLKEEAEATAETAVSEAELFAEINETAPKKKGMTIAAPAEEESEVESLKRRLAELTGAPEKTQSAEPEYITMDEPAADKAAESAEPEVSTAVEAAAVEQAGAEPELISLEQLVNDAVAASEEIDPAQLIQTADTEEADSVQAFEDELSQFLSDESEIDDKTPVYGLTPYSELEEEMQEEAAAAEAESEVITLTGPEPDGAADILEAMAEPAAADETAAAAETGAVVQAKSGVIDLSPAATAAAETPQVTDALSLEDLETDLFGETPSPDAEAEVTKKIDKFYTLYRKNEEFQRLLDEEYSKLKTESHPAAVEPSKPAVTGAAAAPVREVEDVTIYQELTPEEQKALAEAEAAQAARAEVEAVVAATEPQPAEVKAAPVEWDQVAAEEKAAAKKETRKEKKERKKREQEELKAREAAVDAAASGYEYDDAEQGSVFLTVVAVIIAILLVVLLAIILVLNFAPDSGIALQIDSVIENITSHFSAIDNTGGQYLL